MLSDSDIVQFKSGSFNGTSGSASLDVATTAGNTVLIYAMAGGGGFSGVPSGFVGDTPAGAVRAWSKNAVDGETSWTLPATVSSPVAWVVEERAGLDQTTRVDVAGTSVTATLASNTTVATSTYDGFVVVLHGAYNSTGGTAATLGSQTNGLEELYEQTASDGTKACVLAVSRKYVQSIGTQQSTATASGTTPTSTASIIVVYTAAGARRAADVHWCGGAEIGSTTGLTATSTWASGVTLPYLDLAANVTVDAAAARTGNFGWRINSSAALGYLRLSNTSITVGASRYIDRFSFRFRTALPGGDRVLFEASGWTGRWISASQKIGLKHSTGSEVLSDAVVNQTGVWYSIDRDIDQTVTQYVHDWQITYGDDTIPVVQTQALSATGQTAPVAADARVGTAITAQTLDMDVDDWVVSITRGHYPLGNMRVYPLKIDPAGTPTVSGTAANFQTFASNGTGTAFNATNARNAVDDIPPTIGASADGVMQVTADAASYVELPAETVNLATVPGSLRGVRACVAGWAAAATTATIYVAAYDGATEYPLVHSVGAAVDPNWDNAAEAWSCAMVKPTSGRILWDQTKLDALALRVGRSDDATPDIGIHAFVFEAAVRMTETQQLFGDLASIAKDPDSAGVQTVTVVAPTGYPTDLYYEENTTPTTVNVGSGATVTEPVLAPDGPTLNYLAAYPAAEPYTG